MAEVCGFPGIDQTVTNRLATLFGRQRAVDRQRLALWFGRFASREVLRLDQLRGHEVEMERCAALLDHLSRQDATNQRQESARVLFSLAGEVSFASRFVQGA